MLAILGAISLVGAAILVFVPITEVLWAGRVSAAEAILDGYADLVIGVLVGATALLIIGVGLLIAAARTRRR